MGLFSKLTKSANRKVNKDVLEAAAAAGLLVAASEGGITKDELNGVKNALSAHPKIEGAFSKRDVDAVVSKYSSILEDNFRVGRTQMLREIEDVAENANDAEDVLVLAISIAEKDGDIGEKEMSVLNDIANRLSFKLEDVM
jgi:tellurite resistance protein TerB